VAPGGNRQNISSGILLILVAMTLVPVMDGIAKMLSARYSVVEIVWARYFFHLLFLLPMVFAKYSVRDMLPEKPILQVIRGGLLLVSTGLFFAALAVMPLADALALVFISPLIVTALSPLLLGESVGPRRWVAVIVGFVGALIIIRPGGADIGSGTIMAASAGTVYAFYLIATRKLSGTAPPLITLMYTALLGGVVMSLIVPFFWVRPNLNDVAMMMAMGGIAALGHYFLIKAVELAPVSILAPFGYSEIVMATLVGYVLFGDFPDSWTWVGIAVIVASGIYISVRENQRKDHLATDAIIVAQAQEGVIITPETKTGRKAR